MTLNTVSTEFSCSLGQGVWFKRTNCFHSKRGETNGLAVLFGDLLKNLARSQRSTAIGYASVVPSDAAIPLTEIFKSFWAPYGKTSLPSVTIY